MPLYSIGADYGFVNRSADSYLADMIDFFSIVLGHQFEEWDRYLWSRLEVTTFNY